MLSNFHHKRLLLDTNVYGEILIEKSPDKLISALQKLSVYGFSLIRKEIRDIPSQILLRNRNFHISVLEAYRLMNEARDLRMPEFIDYDLFKKRLHV